jgi:hypothetical protein
MIFPYPPTLRNIIAIGLITLLLFNVAGYQGLLVGLQYSNDQKITRFADLDLYQASELTTIKIPMALPYPTGSVNVERANRKIEFKGEHYQLIKQKFDQDTLYLMCVKDHDGKHIQEAYTDFAKRLTDQPVDTGHGAKVLPSFVKEYLASAFDIDQATDGWRLQLLPKNFQPSMLGEFTTAVNQPPEA